jgi:catechol 2,3-dioxygenase-like lactoylglutathione lyase family enzyme
LSPQTDAMSSVPTHSTASTVPIRGLHHFAYRCRDCEETRRFYEDLLGLPLVHAVKAEDLSNSGEGCPFVQMFFAMGDGCCIAFFDLGDGDMAPNMPDRRRWASHLAMCVDSLDALRAAKARLAAAGVDVLGPVDRGTIHSITFFDPNGIRLELTTPTAADARGRRAERAGAPRGRALDDTQACRSRSPIRRRPLLGGQRATTHRMTARRTAFSGSTP